MKNTGYDLSDILERKTRIFKFTETHYITVIIDDKYGCCMSGNTAAVATEAAEQSPAARCQGNHNADPCSRQHA